MSDTPENYEQFNAVYTDLCEVFDNSLLCNKFYKCLIRNFFLHERSEYIKNEYLGSI